MFDPKVIMAEFNKKYAEDHYTKDNLPNKGPDFSSKDFTDEKVKSFKKLLDLDIFSKVTFQ